MLKAAILLWLPVALIPLGIWYSQSRKLPLKKNLGRFLSLLGLVMILASPWTVPNSPSSALGHLLGFIIGPSILISLGLYKMAYSGNVPVGRLSKNETIIGVIFFFVGIIWLSLMHWWELTPTMSTGEVNPYWLIFMPTFLISLTSISLAAAFSMLIFGDNRGSESKTLFLTSALSFSFLFVSMNLDSTNLTVEKSREFIWFSIADLFGILIGSILSIISFAVVIYIYERSLNDPNNIEPPKEKELAIVSEVISNNLVGDE